MQIPVHGVSKFDQKSADVPASVTIITADDIQKYGFRTLAELLKSVRGFNITNDRNYSYAGFRGLSSTGDYNSRFLLQIDGHRVNDGVYHQAFIGTEAIIDLDLIDRVEIIRGSGSSLYGSNAFYGIINIITKKSNSIGQPEIAASYGSYDYYKGRLSYGRKYENGLDVTFSGTGYFNGGRDRYYAEFNNPPLSDGIAQGADTDKSRTFFGRMAYGPFTFEGAWSSREKTLPTAPYGTDFNTKDTYTVDRNWYLDWKYYQTIAGDTEVTGRLFFDQSGYRGDYVTGGAVNRDTDLGQSIGGELLVSRPFFNNAHRLTAGLEFVDFLHQDQKNYDLDPYEVHLDSSETNRRWAFYVQEEYVPVKWLRINGGICWDYEKNFGSQVNPRFAVILQPDDRSAIKLISGSALRPPNAYELYYEDGATMERSSDLKSERIITYEAIVERRLFTDYRLSFGGFTYRINDMIRPVNDPDTEMLVFKNVGELTAKGVEVELEGVWSMNLRGTIGYTFQEAEDSETGTSPVNSPKHIGKLNLILPFFRDNWSLGTNIQYMSPRQNNDGSSTASVFVVNTNLLMKELWQGVSLSISCLNLLDQKYKDPVGVEFQQQSIEQDGRVLFIKASYAF